MTIGLISSEKAAMKFSATWAGEGQAFFVASALSPADAVQAAGDAYTRIAELLREQKLAIVHERIFGSLSAEGSVMAARHHALQTCGISSNTLVTYTQGVPPWGEGLAGVIIHAVTAADVWPITDNGMPCGRGWRRNGLMYLMLQNITAVSLHPPLNPLPSREGKREVPQSLASDNNSARFLSLKRDSLEIPPHSLRPNSLIDSPPLRGGDRGEGETGAPTDDSLKMSKPMQTRLMLERAERILCENNASYKAVARTWIYLSEILKWYPEFNKARSEKYGEFGIMPGPGDTRLLLPASTGIGADTPSGAAASMDLLAVVENGDAPSRVKKLTNMKQLDAFRYGAAFSRGAVIKEENVTLIQISGTAAIDEHGKSLFQEDIRSQINCTFDKIDSLLKQEGAGLADICAATVFVKRPEYAELFWEMAAERGLPDFPAVCVVADVCREELLFEIDAEAAILQ